MTGDIPGPRVPLDDLMAIADAVGLTTPHDVDEPIPYTLPGLQPACEFTAGPIGFGPRWTDDALADVLAGWLDEMGEPPVDADTCPTCGGRGVIPGTTLDDAGRPRGDDCPTCNGGTR